MFFYHYTSSECLQEILSKNQINTTASNLLKPVAPHVFNHNLADITDNVKPVVWLTNTLDFDNAIANGLTYEKTEAVIVIPSTLPISFQKWDKWAKKNGIDNNWFNVLKKTAPNWDTFYISEAPIPITNAINIVFRPDIMELLKST